MKIYILLVSLSVLDKERLWVVGSNKETAKLIEQSYIELLKCLEKHFKQHIFLLGNFPSSSDFAFWTTPTVDKF